MFCDLLLCCVLRSHRASTVILVILYIIWFYCDICSVEDFKGESETKMKKEFRGKPEICTQQSVSVTSSSEKNLQKGDKHNEQLFFHL